MPGSIRKPRRVLTEGRNKMEIYFIRRLCRPEKFCSPRKCGICVPLAHKLCAQSRRNLFCQKSTRFFGSLKNAAKPRFSDSYPRSPADFRTKDSS